jgi:hypothetical protein
MKLKQIVLSKWNSFLKITGLATVIEIVVLIREEVKQEEGKQ